jgi:MFS family permease
MLRGAPPTEGFVPGNWLTRNFPALASPDYALLFTNAVFAAAAHWALLLARGWLVWELSESSTAVGLVTFAGMSPFIFAGPVAGAIADRFDRRTLSLYASFVAFAGTLGLAAVTLTDVVAVWHVVVFALLEGTARAAHAPAAQAMIPNIVPREHLLNGVALQNISNHGTRLIGPLLGGVLLTAVGAGAVFLLSAGLFASGAVALWRIQYRYVAAEGAERMSPAGLLRDIAEGMQHIGRDPRLMLVITLVVFHCALTMAFEAMLPQLVTTVGGESPTYTGMWMGIGAGAVIGTVWVSKLGTDVALGRAIVVTAIGSAVAMLVIGFSVVPAMAIGGAMLAGGTQAAYMALTAALIQVVTPDHLRGRVLSIFIMLAGGHMAFVNLGFGAGADIVGVRLLFIVPALLWLFVFVAASAWFADLRYLLRTGTFVGTRPVTVTSEVAVGGGAGGGAAGGGGAAAGGGGAA